MYVMCFIQYQGKAVKENKGELLTSYLLEMEFYQIISSRKLLLETFIYFQWFYYKFSVPDLALSIIRLST